MQMRERIHGVSITKLRHDIVFYSWLSTFTFIPFITPLSELCIEVGQHYQKRERMLQDVQGNIIMDFNLDAIKIIFQ